MKMAGLFGLLLVSQIAFAGPTRKISDCMRWLMGKSLPETSREVSSLQADALGRRETLVEFKEGVIKVIDTGENDADDSPFRKISIGVPLTQEQKAAISAIENPFDNFVATEETKEALTRLLGLASFELHKVWFDFYSMTNPGELWINIRPKWPAFYKLMHKQIASVLVQAAFQDVPFNLSSSALPSPDLLDQDNVRVELPTLFGSIPVIKKRPHCFTGKMCVATPNGQIEIEKLDVGDVVYSYNEFSGKIVENVIEMIESPDEPQYYDTLASLTKAIEVTPGHLFFLPEEGSFTGRGPFGHDGGGYRRIGMIGPDEKLLYFPNPMKSGFSRKISRGEFKSDGKSAKVYNLHLKSEPHNYLVNGIVVHNIKK